jgi:hypothetical protein
MHVFVRICMYAISTKNMPSIIVYMTLASDVYVFECMCMYLYVSCMYLHVFVRICKYSISTEQKLSILHDCASVHDLSVRCVWILCILYVFACIMYVLVRIKQYLYVYVYICVYTFIND